MEGVETNNGVETGRDRVNQGLYPALGSATLDAWPLMKTVQDSLENPQSHERPIVQVLCVTKLNLVITVCTGSTLKVEGGQ